jgi:hypothetical protein
VDVRVDHTRKDDEIAGIEDLAAAGSIVIDSGDRSVFYVNGCPPEAVRKDDA